MDARDAVLLIQWLVNHRQRDVGNRCIDIVQRLKLCRDEGDDVVVCETAVEALDADARTKLFAKLSELRNDAIAAAADAPGLASELDDAERALRQAPVYEKKKYYAKKQRCEARLKRAIRKHETALHMRMREIELEQLEWRVFNARVEKYWRQGRYDKVCKVRRPLVRDNSECSVYG